MPPPCPTGTELLAGVDDDAFKAAVDLDLRRRAPADVAAALRSPAVRDRWLTVMLAMHRKTEGTLAARRADWNSFMIESCAGEERLVRERDRARGRRRRALNAELAELRRVRAARHAEYERQRAGSILFKTGLEEWLIEARALCDGTRDEAVSALRAALDEGAGLDERVAHIRTAIAVLER